MNRLWTSAAGLASRLRSLIATRFDLVEVKILSAGLLLAGLLGLGLVAAVVFAGPQLYKTLTSTAVLHLMGGRALGVATCLSAGLPIWFTIAYNFYLEVMIVLVAYGVVVLIMRNLVEPTLLRGAVRQAELSAQRQRTAIKRFGAVGLFVFVMFPFMMTGPVIGAIIGYLLHYRPISNLSIVFSGTLTAIVLYSLVGTNLLVLLGRWVDLEALRTWGGIAVGMLILVFVVYHVGTIKRLLDDGDGDD